MQKQGEYPDVPSKSTLIEWRVCDNDTEWELGHSASLDALTTTREPPTWKQRTILHWGLAVALTMLIVGLPLAWWLWHQAQLGVAEVQSQLHAAANADLWSAVHIPPTQASESERNYLNDILLRSPQDAQEKVTGIEIRDLGKDWSVVRIFLHLQNHGPSYRQTRIYRKNDRGWQRAAVTTAMWGQARQVETDHFVFNYRSLDQEAVTEASAHIEASYESIYHTLFAREPEDEKVVIMVDPEKRLEVRKHGEQPSSIITTGSPAAILANADLSEADLLAQSVVLELLFKLLQKASDNGWVPARWQSFRDGVRLWLMWDQELPLASWRHPVVRLVFSQSPIEEGSQHSSFSDFAYNLCASHALWMTTPLEIGIPLTCLPRTTTLDLANDSQILSWRIAASQAGTIALPAALANGPGDRSNGATDSTTKVVVLATVVDYIASIYGRERLPTLSAALYKHEKWETLIPAVFGISEDEFTAGWHEFLNKEYGIKEE